MIEIHEGTSGYYLHDPDDHLRFGWQETPATRPATTWSSATTTPSGNIDITDTTKEWQ